MNVQSIWHDPVVEEIHRVRRELAEHYHHDLDAITKAAVEQAHALGFVVKAPSPSAAELLVTKAS